MLNALLLVLSLPFVLLTCVPIAVANRLAMGSWRRVFFCQARIGWRGRLFRMYKFRTLVDSEHDDYEAWKSGLDGLRATRFGAFLRRTHLDELPQVLNVLRGEMAFIGPRPEIPEVEAWAAGRIRGFGERLVLKPGITGYAQVTQGYVGFDVDGYRLKKDANEHYRRSLTLRMDLAILLLTARRILLARTIQEQLSQASRLGS